MEQPHYDLHIDRDALAYVARLDGSTQARIFRRLDQIAEDPYGHNTKALRQAGGRRSSRVGAWRIVFRVDATRRVVEVDDIGPRGQIYRGL